MTKLVGAMVRGVPSALTLYPIRRASALKVHNLYCRPYALTQDKISSAGQSSELKGEKDKLRQLFL